MDLREKILALRGKRKVLPLEIPEWETSVYVREMTAAEREEYMSHFVVQVDQRGKKKIGYKGSTLLLAQLCLCDAKGLPLFGDGDRELLADLPAKGMSRFQKFAEELNQIDDPDDADEDGLSQRKLKNSEEEPASDS